MELTTKAKAKLRTNRGREVLQKCTVAQELEKAGDYEGARAALAGVWGVIGERPQIENLPPKTQAEVLLRVGALSGWLGSSLQLAQAQAFAKDLIAESIRVFERVGNQDKVAEAQTDLAVCYWREGAMDEARVWFREALTCASGPENKVRVLLNSTIVEISSNRLSEALSLLDQAAPLLDQVDNHATRGRYHMQRAIVFKRLGGAENLDRALIENTAASIHFEQANHKRYFARVENNIGFIFLLLNRYDDALHHLDKARNAFIDLKDVGTAAQVNETRAQVFLAQRRYVEAERAALVAVSALQEGGEQSNLAEALVTHGVALARMGRQESALTKLRQAAEVAKTAGDPELSGRAFLTILEEVHFLTPAETLDLYCTADDCISNHPDPETMNRLRSCARLVFAKADTATTSPEDLRIGGSLEEEMLRYEGELIRQALDQAKGSVTRAAKLLGLTHQGVCYIINTRHKNLLSARAPIRVRRKSIIKKW